MVIDRWEDAQFGLDHRVGHPGAFSLSVAGPKPEAPFQSKFHPSLALLKVHRPRIGMFDAGIGGNRILHDPADNPRFGVNALARFDRDVLTQPNVKYVIVLEGINDLGHPGQSGAGVGDGEGGRHY